MRVALFSGNYNYLKEGANQALNRLVDYLERAHGCEVRAYSPVGAMAAFEPAGTLVPVPSVALPVRSEFRLGLGLPRAIRDDIRGFAPDIVHVSTPDILNTRAQTFAKALGVPIVASMHTKFETYLGYYGLDWLRPLVEVHLRRFYRRSDHVVAPTPALVADFKAMRGDEHVSLWSRGVDRALFDPARRDLAWRRNIGIGDDEIAVLFFGRLVVEKGIDVFNEAVERLHARGLPVRAIALGAGPAATRFKALKGSIMLGHLEGEQLARAVASADIMLTPSTTEAFGNVVLEALASGRVVVSADVPSARALIDDGVSGILVAPREAAAYADTIDALMADPDRRHAMGRAAREASATFSWDAAGESVYAIYRSLAPDAG